MEILRRNIVASLPVLQARSAAFTASAIYIGEVCRYLLAQPERPTDKAHSVRVMFGNGLRSQIWEQFVERFGVKKMVEFYGATEGNSNIANIDSHVGAVGFVSRIAPFVYPVTLIRVNEETGEPLRDSNGMSIKCKPGEAGQFVGKIVSGVPERAFDGYLDQSANEKKIARDVFNKGDMAFMSGDTMIMDELGYLYFKDRLGDTFRWKGENVSTVEVEAIISNAMDLKDCIVYGVHVPGTEGRAGMAAVLDEHNKLDLEILGKTLTKALPSYARPIFLRVMNKLPITGTFKFKKVALQEANFDPSKCPECKLFYWNNNCYSPIDDKVFKDICDGKVKL